MLTLAEPRDQPIGCEPAQEDGERVRATVHPVCWIYGVTTTSPSDTGPSAEKTTVPVGVRTVTETTSRPEPNPPPSRAYPVTMYPGWPALGPTTVKSTRRPAPDEEVGHGPAGLDRSIGPGVCSHDIAVEPGG